MLRLLRPEGRTNLGECHIPVGLEAVPPGEHRHRSGGALLRRTLQSPAGDCKDAASVNVVLGRPAHLRVELPD